MVYSNNNGAFCNSAVTVCAAMVHQPRKEVFGTTLHCLGARILEISAPAPIMTRRRPQVQCMGQQIAVVAGGVFDLDATDA